MSASLPFQIQHRILGKNRQAYWMILSKDAMPTDRSKLSIFALTANQYPEIMNCGPDITPDHKKLISPVFKNSGLTQKWNCADDLSQCQIIESGTYQKPTEKAEYLLSFTTGPIAGNLINFTWAAPPAEGEGFRQGKLYLKECTGNNTTLQSAVPEAQQCTDIWNKEKRWTYFNTPVVRKAFMQYIDHHPFRFRYVSTTQRDKVPEARRTPTTGVGDSWVRNQHGTKEPNHFPVDITEKTIPDFLSHLNSGITEIHYEPAVDMKGDKAIRLKTISEIINDMDVAPGYPLAKITETAKIAQNLAPRIVAKVLDIPVKEIHSQIIFTGKSSYHQHITIPKSAAVPYGGKGTETELTASGLICRIADAVNKKLGEERVVCGEGHTAKQIGFDFASCNAPGKNCITPYSFRIPDPAKGIYTCYVAVPVNFTKTPQFDPAINATADAVMYPKGGK